MFFDREAETESYSYIDGSDPEVFAQALIRAFLIDFHAGLGIILLDVPTPPDAGPDWKVRILDAAKALTDEHFPPRRGTSSDEDHPLQQV